MSLTKGFSKAGIGRNIAKEMAANKPRKQTIAIALNTTREAAKKAGKPSKAPKKKGK